MSDNVVQGGRLYERYGKVSTPLNGVGVEAKAAAYTLKLDDSGKVFSNEGASALVVLSLPAAEAGLKYTFAAQDADGIQVKAAAGDTIREAAGVSSAGGTATSGALGDVLTIVALNSTEWYVESSIGTWTLA